MDQVADAMIGDPAGHHGFATSSPTLGADLDPELSGVNTPAGQAGLTVAMISAGRQPFAQGARGAADREAPEIWAGRDAPRIPGYEILGELGRGGMGVVYLARRTQLDRLCALKMILAGDLAGREPAIRFLTEAATVARLRHPHIAQIYHLGQHDERPFLELEYVEGGSLAQKLDGTPWAPRPAARLVELLARAIGVAHQQGIVHRDLKPGNILLASDGTPKVSDFGLAKSLGEDSSLTQSGAILGSPSYMSPEQAAGGTRRAGLAADIYALGAILYELLTGRPPFRAATVLETLEQARTVEPLAPARLVLGLPRDLETIVLKCLQKDPARRYESAETLAEDLRRFQGGETIVARPVGSLERARRWCLRNRSLAAAIGTAALALVAVVALVLLYADRQHRFATEQSRATREITGLAERLNISLVESNRRLSIRNFERGQTEFERGRTGHGLLWLLESWRSAHAARDPSWQRAARAAIAGWLPVQPGIRAVFSHEAPVVSAAWSPDGKRIVTGSEDASARIWEAPSGRLAGSPLTHPGPVTALAFNPAGTVLATASSDGVRLWDATSWQPIGSLLDVPGGVHAVAFRPDGREVAAGCQDGKVRRWNPASGQPPGQPMAHGQAVHCVAFSPDGRTILSGSADGTARLWDAATGRPVGRAMAHEEPVMCASFSPDGKLLLTGCNDGKARIWDAATQTAVGAPLPHQAAVRVALFHPGGKIVLTGSVDKSVRLWDARTRQALGPPIYHEGPVEAGAFGPDGRSVLTGGGDYTVRLWDTESQEPLLLRLEHEGPVVAVAYSPDRRVLLTASWDRTARLWDAATGKPLVPPLGHPHEVWAAAFSPDDRLVLTGCADSVARVWSARDGTLLRSLVAHGGPVSVVGFSPDGAIIVTGSQDHTVRLWDAATGRSLGEPLEMPGGVDALAFSPDGRTFLAGTDSGSVYLGDLAARSLAGRRFTHPGAVSGVSFSPHGRSVLIGGEDGTSRLRDLGSGALLTPPLSHQAWVFGVAFSPDGRTILTGSWDRSARLWDATVGMPLGPPFSLTDKISAVAFGPDGKTVLVGCSDKSARLFRLPSELPDDFNRVELEVGLLTGLELDDQSAIRVLDNRAWLDRRDRLELSAGAIPRAAPSTQTDR